MVDFLIVLENCTGMNPNTFGFTLNTDIIEFCSYGFFFLLNHIHKSFAIVFCGVIIWLGEHKIAAILIHNKIWII